MGNTAEASSCCNRRGDVTLVFIAQTEGMSESETVALAKQGSEGLAMSTRYPSQDVANILLGQRSTSLGDGVSVDRPASWGHEPSSMGPGETS